MRNVNLPNQNLRQYLQDKGVTQEQLAQRMGISYMTLNRKLRNELNENVLCSMVLIVDSIAEQQISFAELKEIIKNNNSILVSRIYENTELSDVEKQELAFAVYCCGK